MKISCIKLSLIIMFFITLNSMNSPVSGETINSLPTPVEEKVRAIGDNKKEELTADPAYTSRTFKKFPTHRNNNGWKAGEGNKENLYKGPVYKKGKIPDNSGSVTNGCFVTFIGIPVGLLILYIIYEYLKNAGGKTSNTTYYYDKNGKIDRMSEE